MSHLGPWNSLLLLTLVFQTQNFFPGMLEWLIYDGSQDMINVISFYTQGYKESCFNSYPCSSYSACSTQLASRQLYGQVKHSLTMETLHLLLCTCRKLFSQICWCYFWFSFPLNCHFIREDFSDFLSHFSILPMSFLYRSPFYFYS